MKSNPSKEKALARRLNKAKHIAPEAVYKKLNISTGWIMYPITITVQSGKIYAGSGNDEFCCELGSSFSEATKYLDSNGL